jgi:hypothetical protein
MKGVALVATIALLGAFMLSMPRMQKDRLKYSRTGRLRSNQTLCLAIQ